MDVSAASDVRQGYSIDFIKSTADPVRYAVAPPNTHNNSAFIKKLDFSMNFPVGDDENLAAERVPTQTGLILQFPLLGANSVWHMGVVPGGATVANNNETSPGQRGLASKIKYLTYDAPLALPYSALSAVDQIKIAPDLASDFSITRMFSSVLTLSSPTVPVAGVAFNGQLAIGIVHDTRDIAQVPAGGGAYGVYSSTDLSQQSVTSKDGIRDVKSEDGVTGIQGSEIDTDYSPPNQARIDCAHGEWVTVPIQLGFSVAPDMTFAASNIGLVYCLSSAWISPWQTTCETWQAQDQQPTGGPPAVPVPLQRIITDAIGESDVLDIDISGVYIKSSLDVSSGQVRFWTLQAQAIHVFACCTSAGNVFYSTFMESKTVGFNTNSFSGTNATNNYAGSNILSLGLCQFHPKKFQEGMTTTGKYIGTSINISIITSGGPQAGTEPATTFTLGADFMGPPVGQQDPTTGSTSGAAFFIKPHALYTRGVIGPCKVFRWDGQSRNSVMRLEGIARVQCIPQGSIAPYVQSAAMNAPNAVDLNALCVVSELYNGNTSFQRSWRSQDYYRWIREFIPTIDGANLFREAKDSTKTLAALEAGGIFDAIGQGLAGLGMGVGKGIAGLLGAAGQFGYTSGMQQGLEGAGQFYAGGQFGGGVRRDRM